MKRRILFLFVALTAVWLQNQAQIRYEQWIDGNRTNAQWGNLILGEQTLSVNASGMSWPGLHFLNILPYDESGEPGVWKCIAFLMPEYWPATNDATQVEYWVTGYDQRPHRLPYGGTAVTLDIDASQYSAGLHFLNYRTLNARGEGGAWKVIPFLMPEYWPSTNDATQVEYWVTGYDQRPHCESYAGTAVTLDIDASQYSAGLHFLNYRTLNARGEGGAWKVIPFLMPEYWPGTNEAKWMEYWVAGYDSKPKRMEYTGSEVPLDIDISQMSYGLHFLNFRTFNERGEAGSWKQIMFYISNGIFDPEEVEYEYWIDDGEHVSRTGTMPSTLALPIDISEFQHGEHTFNFRGKNSYGTYGETFTTKFYVTIFGDVNDDGKVDAEDIVDMVNFIMVNKSNKFDEKAADVNEDGVVNNADVVKIATIIIEE